MYFFNKRAWLNSLKKELQQINKDIADCRKLQFKHSTRKDFSAGLAARLKEHTTNHAWKSLEIEKINIPQTH